MSKTSFGLSHKAVEEIYLKRILKSCSEEEALVLCRKHRNDLERFFVDCDMLREVIDQYFVMELKLSRELTPRDRDYEK